MKIKLEPFWTDNVPKPADIPICKEIPSSSDVVVIGGGYTGLSAALELATNQIAVTVLEGREIGWGASTRNGGITGCGLKRGAADIFRRYGDHLGHKFWEQSLLALENLKSLLAEHNIECDFSQHGDICLAVKPQHFEALQSKAAWHKRVLNHNLELISPNDLHTEIGSPEYYGGLLDPHGAGLHPSKLLFGLAKAASKSGAQLCEHSEVKQIRKNKQGFHLITTRGETQAREVLLATNGYTDNNLPSLQPRVIPIGSYSIVTEPLPADILDKLNPNGRVFWDSKWFLNYFRVTPDGRLLWGGRNNLSTTLDLEQSAQILGGQMRRAFPMLSDYQITHSWSGHLGLTFDLMPHIGKVNGLHYALGYGGHGVHLTTLLGKQSAEMILQGKSNSPFAQIKHQTYFFHRNKPWFLPLVAQYYRLKDLTS